MMKREMLIWRRREEQGWVGEKGGLCNMFEQERGGEETLRGEEIERESDDDW